MKKKSLIFLLFFSYYARAQTITTYAGGGSSLADGVPAIAENIGYFGGLVVNTDGNLFIADGNHNKIQKVNLATGIITTVAGTGTAGFSGDSGVATSAMLNGPTWITIDNRDNLYITDGNNLRIRKVNATTGIITTVAGNGSSTFNGDGISAITAAINPQKAITDQYGNLYISDNGNQRVRKVDTFGIITTIAGKGVAGYSGDSGLADSAEIKSCYGLCIDINDNIYIADWTDHRIRRIDHISNVITTISGDGTSAYTGDEIPATTAQIDPFDITFSNAGNMYIADAHNARIRMINMVSDTIFTVAGNGTPGFGGDSGLATLAEIYHPEGVVLDACDNLYIADDFNNRVRKVTYPPTPITLTNAIAGSTADTLCGAMPVTFTATAAASSGAVTYQWYVNGSALSTTGSTYTYTPANGDSIRCVAMAANACTAAITSSNIINMVVNTVTTPTITITAPAAAAAGSVVSVNATVAGPASYSIRWYDNGVLFNTTTVPMVTYTKGAGVDNITATVVASEGCYDSSMSAVAIVTATTETSPSFGSAQDRLEVLRTFPNPVHGSLTLTLAGGAGIVSYRLMSMVGSVMREGVLKEGDNMMWVEEIPVGVYMLEVVDGDGGKTVRKIVKE